MAPWRRARAVTLSALRRDAVELAAVVVRCPHGAAADHDSGEAAGRGPRERRLRDDLPGGRVDADERLVGDGPHGPAAGGHAEELALLDGHGGRDRPGGLVAARDHVLVRVRRPDAALAD